MCLKEKIRCLKTVQLNVPDIHLAQVCHYVKTGVIRLY